MLTALYALVLLAAIVILVLLAIDAKLKKVIGALENVNDSVQMLIKD
jgi:hypothetical protein